MPAGNLIAKIWLLSEGFVSSIQCNAISLIAMESHMNTGTASLTAWSAHMRSVTVSLLRMAGVMSIKNS
jgi:hypothetical protein